ncbi:TonB-dependent receptor domain-containing protein [Hydromonas duriensis]|uniref:Vitamin B12 transporter n=1 Tax=Hydromonas duriensis TaxID=1527608 RepID=A0A4R6Y743_9BURK|nr:TonB-dependent receptor [Hydromonas duriensis]TDR30890.1 vitamin B12 transporter [Hydromonas duriensis]
MTVFKTDARLVCPKFTRAYVRIQMVWGGCVMLGASAAYAQTPAAKNQADDKALPEVVITAARSEQMVADALPSTTVISRADIENASVSDVSSLLRMQTGVVIRQSGVQGSRPTGVTMRGAEPRHTLILLDGVPMSSLSAGTGALEQIPLSVIERIEIVRGNVSALYGSQATGGVVQVFTRKMSAEQNLTVRVAAGSHGQRQASAQVSGGTDKVQATFGIAHEEENAISAMNQTVRPFANADKDKYKNDSANGAVRYRPNDNNEFGLRFFESRGKGDYDNQYDDPDANLHNTVRLQNISLYSNNRITDYWKSSLRLSQYTDKANNYAYYGNDENKTRTREMVWQNDIHSEMGDYIIGFSHNQQKLSSTTAYDNTSRKTDSMWLGYVLDKNRHHLQLNARTDKMSGLARENTGSINYGFDVSERWRVFGGYSNGFSAPTFDELYYPGYYAFGTYYPSSNPNLKSEHAVYTQIGAQYVGEHLTSRITAFETRYRDKIALDSNYIPYNLNRATAKGIEWHGTYNQNGWTADIGLTYQNVENTDTGERLLRQPRVFGSIGVGKTWGKWSAQLNWQLQGHMKDVEGSTVAGYGVLNAAAYYNLTKTLKFGLSVGNVFNRTYQPLYGYNAMPRNVLLSLQYQPKW